MLSCNFILKPEQCFTCLQQPDSPGPVKGRRRLVGATCPCAQTQSPQLLSRALSRGQGCRSRQGYTRGKKRSELNKKLTLDDKQTQTIRTYSQKLKLQKKKKQKHTDVKKASTQHENELFTHLLLGSLPGKVKLCLIYDQRVGLPSTSTTQCVLNPGLRAHSFLRASRTTCTPLQWPLSQVGKL